MASLTVRNIDDSIERRLRMRAASEGRSMEEEVRRVLAKSVEHVGENAAAEVASARLDAEAGGRGGPERWGREESAGEMFERIKKAHGGGVDLDLPDRSEWKDRPLDLE